MREESWVTEPRLKWKVKSDAQQSASLRLTYQALAFDWEASYGLILDRAGSLASLSGKVGLENKTDVDIKQARVTIVRTEQGETGSLLSATAEKRGRKRGGTRPKRPTVSQSPKTTITDIQLTYEFGCRIRKPVLSFTTLRLRVMGLPRIPAFFLEPHSRFDPGSPQIPEIL